MHFVTLVGAACVRACVGRSLKNVGETCVVCFCFTFEIFFFRFVLRRSKILVLGGAGQ